ncbi:copper transporter [Actinomycetospora termitidis]|uniref:Copper transporter n=1 Tax=Actinomycetospora termitidis TaxID=3053470 RepID=A0ABT7MGA1_9PSEU|nr:copper transporter [Actinomycetospora sp. Odt1-22]MDL5158383.1 copper transporter [Actinomycetospora sp. Odt1-22]
MISFRYHVVSLCAVVLALALGVVLGASSLSQTMLGALSTDRADLSGQVGTLTAERDTARAEQAAADRVLAGAAPSLVGGTLPGRTVVVVAAPGADPADLEALTGLVGQAGGRVTGSLTLTDAALAPDRADALRGLVTRVLPAGVQLPSTTDAGTLTGALLGSLVTSGRGPTSSPAEIGTAFTALADGGFLAPGAAPAPAQLAVVLAGDAASGPDAAGRATTLAHLAGGVRDGGAGTVLAARSADGAVATARPDQALRGLSTVDGVGTTAGRLAVVLAAAEQAGGRAGAYGASPGVSALPQRTPPPA